MPQIRIRRRTLLVGALAAVVAGPRIFDNVLAPNAGRRRTIAALVDTVVDTADADSAARRIAAEYATALPSRRAATDEVLRALERAHFADASVDDRRTLLRAWARDDAKQHLAARAVALAASGVGPAGDDYRPVPGEALR